MTDPSLSRSLARFWEAKFFDDMARLRVKEPDTLTRVTEYIPEIVEFVKRIIENGYAYEVAGSVYFDTNKFDATKDHSYAKLEPWSKGNKELLEEGEGRYTPISLSWHHFQVLFQALFQLALVADPRPISHSGKHPNRENRSGHLHGGRDVLDGILNAPLWRLPSSGTIWTSIRGELILRSHTMTMR